MQEFIANPLVAGAVAGLIAGAASDISAFRSWKSFDEARQYSWNLAIWRWFQGAVFGVIAAAGLAGLS